MTHENLSLFEAIHSQRAIRHFSEKPVSDEAVEMILNAAIRAPNGGNRQPWRFVVIRDAALKRRLGQWYLAAWQAATANMEALTQPYRHGAELAQQMATVPVLILACIDHGEASPRLGPVTRGASIYPAVQNLLLAARALGLGTVLTTLHTKDIIGDSVDLLYANLYNPPRQNARVSGRDRTDAQRVCACAVSLCCGLCRPLSSRQDLGR